MKLKNLGNLIDIMMQKYFQYYSKASEVLCSLKAIRWGNFNLEIYKGFFLS